MIDFVAVTLCSTHNAEIVTLPVATNVALPLESTVAIDVLELDHGHCFKYDG